ncbi:MAG: IS21 family transposase [Gammaproteobacteria bacterium]|nr:IS21 family transposase [Gammaproteobacteria bacterium]
MTVKNQQVRVYMSQKKEGKTQVTAAAKAGFSERTGRRVEKGECTPGSLKERHWRTRKDPFAAVWESELLPQLEEAPELQAITLQQDLQERYQDKYPNALLRTLQRRVKRWRALAGPEKEVMFNQTHEPGVLGLSDFTTLKNISITVQGQPFSHILYHFRLACSGWCHVKVIHGGESFPALAEGLQNALQRLGGVPREHRSDSLAAAYKNLSQAGQDDLTERYNAFCQHYGMTATRNNPGKSHENGSIESPHGHLKNRIKQALLLRGSTEFKSVGAYQRCLDGIVAGINRGCQAKLDSERPHLQILPLNKAVDYNELTARVTSQSTVNVALTVYSVPSRLIGENLRIHLYDDRFDAWLGCERVFTSPRVRAGKGKRRARCIDYRHMISSLKKKPMAFYRSQYRDDLLPDDNYLCIWQYFDEHPEPRQACKLMVGCLALAAEHDCENALAEHLLQRIREGQIPDLLSLRRCFGAPPPPQPAQQVQQHPPASYDALIDSAREVNHVAQ